MVAENSVGPPVIDGIKTSVTVGDSVVPAGQRVQQPQLHWYFEPV